MCVLLGSLKSFLQIELRCLSTLSGAKGINSVVGARGGREGKGRLRMDIRMHIDLTSRDENGIFLFFSFFFFEGGGTRKKNSILHRARGEEKYNGRADTPAGS